MAVAGLGDRRAALHPARSGPGGGGAVERAGIIGYHALFTVTEILGGLALGVVLGAATALTLSYFRPARRWLMPVLVFSQAIPVFALAPLLVLWMGYGMASKIAMATLIIFFPVTSAFFDGLRRTEPGWLDLAQTMGGSRWSTLLHIRLPAALPAFASGLRVATAVAPIGAVVGEWVGASRRPRLSDAARQRPDAGGPDVRRPADARRHFGDALLRRGRAARRALPWHR